MKNTVNSKLMILPFVFLLSISLVLAASVSRNMPSRVDPGSEVEVKLTLSGAAAGQSVAIEDNVPNTITLTSWSIDGSQEAKEQVSHQQKPSSKAGIDRHSWAFTAASGSPTVTYKFNAPSALGSYEFDVRWVTSEGFNHQASTLTVRTITCGDGVCEGSENSDNCVGDCPKPAAPAPAPAEVPVPTVPEPTKGSGALVALVVVIVIIAGALGYRYMKKGKE